MLFQIHKTVLYKISCLPRPVGYQEENEEDVENNNKV